MYSRVLRMNRYRLRIDKLAREKGFESTEKMLYEMYEVQHLPLKKIGEILVIPMWSLRKRFDELGITVRSKGGRNYIKTIITPELIEEVCRDGVGATADKLGIDQISLNAKLREWYERTGGKFDEDDN